VLCVFWLIGFNKSWAFDCHDNVPLRSYRPAYATHFSIDYFSNFKRLNVDGEHYYVGPKDLLLCSFNSSIIVTPISRVAMYSTTHLPVLELLKKEKLLGGFENPQYIASGNFNIDKIKKLGSHFSPELWRAQKFQLVMANISQFGSEYKRSLVIKMRLPFVDNKDFEEKSPLARAEWIIFNASLFDGEDEAITFFKQIEKNYQDIKLKNSKLINKPKVLVGDINRGYWSTCGGKSDLAQMIKDAGGVLMLSRPSNQTQQVSLEMIQSLSAVDIWLPMNSWSSQVEMKSAISKEPRYKLFSPAKIFNNTKDLNRWRFNTYWQTGMQRPDLMLADLSNLLHPEIYSNHTLKWFKQL